MNCLKFLDIGEYYIPYELFEERQQFPNGQFGTRKLLFHNHKKQLMVLKFMRDTSEATFKAEFLSLSLLNNDNIVKYLAWTQIDDVMGIVMEFMAGGSLDDVIHSKDIKYNFANILWWNIQMARALEYIHSHKHNHLNYKPQNILMDKNLLNVKLCGFENCREMNTMKKAPLDSRDFFYDAPDRDYYIAPEILFPNLRKPSIECDIYSWAIVFWETNQRQIPFYEERSLGISLNRIKTCSDYRLKRIENVPDDINDIIQKCSSINTKDRHSISFIREKLESILSDDEQYGTPRSLAFFAENLLFESLENVFNKDRNFYEYGLFEEKQILGEGAFGEVKLVVYKIEKKQMALKVLKNLQTSMNDFQRELLLLMNLKHDNIIRLIGWTLIDGYPSIIMEFMKGGSLSRAIYNKKVDYSLSDTLLWSLQAARALEYMHGLKYIHRDVKPENLLLTDNLKTLKLCDFGISRPIADKASTYAGTRIYIAPEVLKGLLHDAKCDVFSWALTVWECHTRVRPFSPSLAGKTYHNKYNDNYRLEDIEHIPSQINDLIQKCSHPNPDERYSMKVAREKLEHFSECQISMFPYEDHEGQTNETTKVWCLASGHHFFDTEIDAFIYSCNDLKIGGWNECKSMPPDRYYFDCAAIDSKIYLCGGHDVEGKVYSNELNVYDTITEEWNLLSNMNTVEGVPKCAVFASHNTSYILASHFHQIHNHAVQLYDINREKWTAVQSIKECSPSSRFVGIGDAVLAIHEDRGPNINTFEYFNIERNEWTAFKSPANNYMPGVFGAAYHNGLVYIVNEKTFEKYHPKENVWHSILRPFDDDFDDYILLSFKGNLWAILERRALTSYHIVKMFDERNQKWLYFPPIPICSHTHMRWVVA